MVECVREDMDNGCESYDKREMKLVLDRVSELERAIRDVFREDDPDGFDGRMERLRGLVEEPSPGSRKGK